MLPLDPDNLPQSIITARRSPAPEVLDERLKKSYPPHTGFNVGRTGLNRGSRPPPRDGFGGAENTGGFSAPSDARNIRGGMFAPNISPQSLSDDMAPAEELMALRAQEAADSTIRMSEQGPNFVPEKKILSAERKAALKAEDDRTGAAAQEQNQIDAATGPDTGPDTSVVTSDDSLDS